MAKQLTEFQARRLSRKTGDITRLAGDYQRNINDLTNQYETSFSQYQTKRDAVMAPYETAVAQYTKDFSSYETAMAGYKTRFDNYAKSLVEYNNNPYETVYPVYDRNAGQRVNGQWYEGDYRVNGMLINDYLASVGSPTRVHLGQYLQEGLDYKKPFTYIKKAPDKLTEVAPTAPTQPVKPDMPEFDSAPFDQKRAELSNTYQRETGERKQARANAVSRKQARPLLQGA